MNLSLRQLRYVVAAADCGHVTDAAKRLNVSQPSVSSAIAEVEAEIGVPLFIRHHARGVTLTPVGEKVVNEARLLLKHAQDFAQNAVGLGDALKGEIAVGCFLTLAIRFLPGLLAGFAQRFPGITVALQEGDQEELISSLLSGRTELALAYSLRGAGRNPCRTADRSAALRDRRRQSSAGEAQIGEPAANSPTNPSSCSICPIRAIISSACSARSGASRAWCSSRARRN